MIHNRDIRIVDSYEFFSAKDLAISLGLGISDDASVRSFLRNCDDDEVSTSNPLVVEVLTTKKE